MFGFEKASWILALKPYSELFELKSINYTPKKQIYPIGKLAELPPNEYLRPSTNISNPSAAIKKPPLSAKLAELPITKTSPVQQACRATYHENIPTGKLAELPITKRLQAIAGITKHPDQQARQATHHQTSPGHRRHPNIPTGKLAELHISCPLWHCLPQTGKVHKMLLI
ncbi:hypothetical protein VC83_00148 [Pseudogymnoascus destructans]|uniref:Uncharacterized protein n=1 Tax=Pseudogymnoascus destructans TaxID=655981 RepID=A0A177ANW3_9PEZI|nr:uncharacterized protein VC83_00148 [Pseudogymnoascus destructans]OAF63041.1 hypothetical protein VC83_00148 [Pseudogymnoascus destructans]